MTAERMPAKTPGEQASEAAPASEASPAPEPIELDRALEALLFLADEPLAVVSLATATSTPVRAVQEAIDRLRADYDGESGGPRRAFELREVGGGWRMYVRPELDEVVEDFVVTRQPARLSQAALETLAVIAYRQPVTRQQVASIRAVNVDSVVRTLVARGLIEEAGHEEATGAILYVTSASLLEHLGLNTLEELPKISPMLDDGQELAGWQEPGLGREDAR
ncbi:Segregation and condensation protein B [Pseudoclavibacter triregionum]|nr:Segregation and condensation protein B [Pseudoclavibacter triregionum]